MRIPVRDIHLHATVHGDAWHARTRRPTVVALPPGLGELHVLEDAAHQVLWDQPERAHATIEQFAAEHLGRSDAR